MEFLEMKNTVSKILKNAPAIVTADQAVQRKRFMNVKPQGQKLSQIRHTEKNTGDSVTCESTASGLTYMY